MASHLILEFYDENHFHLNSKNDKVFYSLDEFTKYLEENIISIVSSNIPSNAVYYTVKVYGSDKDIHLTSYTECLFE